MIYTKFFCLIMISTFLFCKGVVLDADDFFRFDINVLWTKYKKKFIVRSLVAPQLEIEFYWTSDFGIKSSTFVLSQPVQYPYLADLLLKLENEDFKNKRKKGNYYFLKDMIEKQAALSNSNLNSTDKLRFGNEGAVSTSMLAANTAQKPFNSKPIKRLQELLHASKDELPTSVFMGEKSTLVI